MNPDPILRRDFLSSLSGGFTGLALTQMLAREAAGSFPKPELNGGIHHPAKVKRVIQLFMNGGVRPMDTWDYKPALTKLDGQKLGSKTKIEGATGMQGALMKSPFEFKQHGQCGKWVSSLFPEQAKLVDEMAFLQAMTGRSNVHGQTPLRPRAFGGMGAEGMKKEIPSNHRAHRRLCPPGLTPRTRRRRQLPLARTRLPVAHPGNQQASHVHAGGR